LKILTALLKVVGWILLAFVGLKVIAATYLAYNSGSSIGLALSGTLMSTLDFDEPKDQVFFFAFVAGAGFLIKSRSLSKMLKTKETNR